MSSELSFFVPSNRYTKKGRPTHVDGLNEIIHANRTNRNVGAAQQRENVCLVADYAAAAMRNQGFKPPVCKTLVYVTFVEVDMRRDVSNIYGGLKWVLDGLSRPRGKKYLGAGAIFDDSPRWVEVIPDLRIDAKRPGVEIYVKTLGG